RGLPRRRETSVHVVRLSALAVDPTAVTNAEFADFVASTDYRTDAERYGSSAVFHLAVTAKPDDILGGRPAHPGG
ncbi:SUMF1/EgtB/PvdO family nonheme iron enzyme, partial [Kribbella turkmenica]|uniref:SUMF1/EgtB/PvdO family nonheme iron enzyme n=1 Tax=Kribbella turkmenica TaxID=2530375 RepID=UPI00192DE3D6